MKRIDRGQKAAPTASIRTTRRSGHLATIEEIPWITSTDPPASAPRHSEIHLWSADLLLTQADESLLDASERQRSLKMAPQRRSEFTIGRTLLRRVLAHYLDLQPEKINISIDSNGKPSLASPQQQLHFSLAHSGHQLMIAFARSPVGLDLETPRPVKNFLKIAERLFQPEEIWRLEAIAEHQRQQYFYHLWTTYEAAQKMHGEGLFGKRTAASYTGSFTLDDGTIGAVCIDGHSSAPVDVRCFAY
ncbi:MAG: 4'-phosphopantetheinyl transferase superfamily protein [Pseudomonadota bacterium]|nr:4'-phosphopantetheinyl transferase superfamily protein [Pseudomonadota bacterium]